jgi:hypothetical protein
MFQSFSSQVEDDGSPAAAANIAAEAIRDLNHRTIGHGQNGGWRYPSDVHRVLIGLEVLLGRLPQTLKQTEQRLGMFDARHLKVDPGDEPNGPHDAIVLIARELRKANGHIARTVAALSTAEAATSRLSYSMPGEVEDG